MNIQSQLITSFLLLIKVQTQFFLSLSLALSILPVLSLPDWIIKHSLAFCAYLHPNPTTLVVSLFELKAHDLLSLKASPYSEVVEYYRACNGYV